MRPIFKAKMIVYQKMANVDVKIMFGETTHLQDPPWVAGNEEIVKNENANIPVSFSWFLRAFLAFLCFPGSAQFIASSS